MSRPGIVPGVIPMLVAAHVACGATALVAMAAALFATKGSPAHVRAGRVFVGAMLGVVALAWGTCALRLLEDPGHPSAGFLALVAVLAGHSTWQGWRAAHRRSLDPSAPDAAVAGAAGLIGIGAVIGSGGQPLQVAFGALTVFTAGLSLRDGIRGHADHPARIRAHIAGVIPACIATVTAVLVVNLRHLPPSVSGLLPPVLWWLLPTFLGVPAIFWFGARTRR